jgi:hypothetical protein
MATTCGGVYELKNKGRMQLHTSVDPSVRWRARAPAPDGVGARAPTRARWLIPCHDRRRLHLRMQTHDLWIY